MFRVNAYQPTANTLTPTKLLMNSANDWSFDHKNNSIANFNPYMSEIDPFDAAADNLFDQKFQQSVPDMVMMPPPSPEEDSSSHSIELVRPQASPLTPPPTTTDTLPKKQRKKLLEKNREAAYRCRQKKKKWIHDLEEKSVIVENKNKELQDQVCHLREESIYLRNLLLTHGNCNCKVVQAYLRRTSEQLSNSMSNTGLTRFSDSSACSTGHENFGN